MSILVATLFEMAAALSKCSILFIFLLFVNKAKNVQQIEIHDMILLLSFIPNQVKINCQKRILVRLRSTRWTSWLLERPVKNCNYQPILLLDNDVLQALARQHGSTPLPTTFALTTSRRQSARRKWVSLISSSTLFFFQDPFSVQVIAPVPSKFTITTDTGESQEIHVGIDNVKGGQPASSFSITT